jgi:hypothetical protein
VLMVLGSGKEARLATMQSGRIDPNDAVCWRLGGSHSQSLNHRLRDLCVATSVLNPRRSVATQKRESRHWRDGRDKSRSALSRLARNVVAFQRGRRFLCRSQVKRPLVPPARWKTSDGTRHFEGQLRFAVDMPDAAWAVTGIPLIL